MIINYLEFVNENKRIDDLIDKYKSKLKLNIIEDLYNMDFTKNKAYFQWLLSFYSTNINDIEKNKIMSFDNLLLFLKKFHNNKQNLSEKNINNIKTVKQLINIVYENSVYKDIDKEKNIQLLYNDNIYSIFIPLTYEMSEKYGWHKWCTVYIEEQFDEHYGYNGELIYIINKVDYTKNYAIEIIYNIYIKLWDYKDELQKTFNNYKDIINFLSKEIDYSILNEILNKINFDKFDFNKKQFIADLVFNYMDYDKYIYRTEKAIKDVKGFIINETEFVNKYIKNDILHYSRNFEEFIDKLQTFDDVKNWIIENCSKKSLFNYLSNHYLHCKKVNDKMEVSEMVNIFKTVDDIIEYFDECPGYRDSIVRQYFKDFILDDIMKFYDLDLDFLIKYIVQNKLMKDFYYYHFNNLPDNELIELNI
jgi:hypothetical protein